MSEIVFVDTSAFFALVAAEDKFHARAVETYKGLTDEQAQLLTSSYVLTETVALIHHRLGFAATQVLVESLRGLINIIWIDGQTHWQAWEFLCKRGGTRLSFVDCTTLLIAQRLDASVFSFDQDFAQEGLSVLPA